VIEPLFTSLDKFNRLRMGEFHRPVETESIVEQQDSSPGITRTEVWSTRGDSHLGHLFHDGPPEVGGLLYCINSASLRFVPLNQRESGAYGRYRRFFQSKEKE
jgi:peptide-methionine (R)-S-oxide reductase